METESRSSRLSNQYLVGGLLVIFIALSVVAMFATSRAPGKLTWIGMKVLPLNSQVRSARGIPATVGGVLVENAAGIAGRAGVRSGDVIVAINGNRVLDMFDFSHFTGETDISKRGAQIDVIRSGARMPVFVFPSATAAAAPGQDAPFAVAAAAARPITQQWLGIEAETLLVGDVKELGLPAGSRGVIVDTVAKGGRAEQAGLVGNDVIVALNGERIDSTVRLWDSLARLNGSDAVELGVYRNGQLSSVAVPAAPATAAGGFGGRMGGQGLGPGGTLVCPNCGTTVAHQWGVPCYTVACPACGTTMVRLSVAAPAAPATAVGGFGGRMGGQGLGPGGTLVCPSCGTTVAHQRGVPCYTVACPACGTTMVRTQ